MHRAQAAKENGSGGAAKTRVRIDKFPVGSQLLNSLMTGVITAARGNKELQHKLFQVRWVSAVLQAVRAPHVPVSVQPRPLPSIWLAVCCPQHRAPAQQPVRTGRLTHAGPQVNFHTTLSGEAMVTMLYHRRLGPPWEAAAAELRAHLLATCAEMTGQLTLAGRSRGQKLALGPGHVTECLRVAGRPLLYRQVGPGTVPSTLWLCWAFLGYAGLQARQAALLCRVWGGSCVEAKARIRLGRQRTARPCVCRSLPAGAACWHDAGQITWTRHFSARSLQFRSVQFRAEHAQARSQAAGVRPVP